MSSMLLRSVAASSVWLQQGHQLLAPSLLGMGAQRLRLFSAKQTEEDSHDDFKPKLKAGAPSTPEDQIKLKISQDKIHVFMKGTPDMPQCGFSRTACLVLNAYGVQYGSTNVLADGEIREGVKKLTGWPTIPQVFVNGEFIGGADIVMNMHDSGELPKLLDPIREEQAKAAKK